MKLKDVDPGKRVVMREPMGDEVRLTYYVRLW